MVSLSGYDGMIYATGWLVGWPALMFLIAEPLRNLGKFTFSDVVAFRLKNKPIRIAGAIGSILVVLAYTIAQMVGSGSLIKLMFGIPMKLLKSSSAVSDHKSSRHVFFFWCDNPSFTWPFKVGFNPGEVYGAVQNLLNRRKC
jgi:hypothetical protein